MVAQILGRLYSRLGQWFWVLALTPLLPAVGLGFLGDDLAARAILGPDQWPFVFECFAPHGGEFYRPLGFLWLQFEMILTMEAGWLLHCFHLVLFGMAAWQTGRLAERLTGRQIGAFVAALALVYPGRLESAVWIIAIFDLLTLVVFQFALLVYLDDDDRSRWWLMIVVAFMAPAFKEVGYAVAPVVTLWWLLGIGRSSACRLRVLSTWIGAVLAMAVRLFAYGGIGGYQGTSVARALKRLTVLPQVLANALSCPVNPTVATWSVLVCGFCVVAALIAGCGAIRLKKGESSGKLMLAGLSLTFVSLLPALPYLRSNVVWAHSRYMTLPAVGIVLLFSAGLLGKQGSRLFVFLPLLVSWSLATILNLVPWVRAAQARDVIIEGIATVSEAPGPHTIWLDGPIGHLDGAHLIGGYLPFALEVEYPDREFESDSRFLQKLQGRTQGPPTEWKGTLHMMKFSRPPSKILEIRSKQETATQDPLTPDGP